MSLAEWHELYIRWLFGDIEVEEDKNGNAVVHPNVVLMPLPSAPGDGTPGSLEVDLNVGQAFVLPLWAWLGTSYTDGTPDDELQDQSIFETLDLTLEIDGYPILDSDSDDLMRYYSEFFFVPEVQLGPEYEPADAIIFFQGVGIVHPPLSKGEHIITLDVVNTEPITVNGDEFFFEYHNTWNVTVETKKK